MPRPRSAIVIAVTLLSAACASVPTLKFNGDDDDSGTPENDGSIADSTVANDAALDSGTAIDAADASGDDANEFADAPLDPDGEAGAVLYKCGNKMVATCAACDGSPMLCLDNGRNECLTDCTICNTALAPCIRCLPNGRQVGQCVMPGAAGVVVCGHSAQRCPCATDGGTGDAAACPSFAGSFQTCFDDGNGLGCETCGELGTANAVCEVSAGVFGKCVKQGAKVGTCK